MALPAICLTVSALLCLVALVFEVLFDLSIVGVSMNKQSNAYLNSQTRICYAVVMGICNVWIIRGAWDMLRLGSYKAARTSAIIACVPCVGPCFVLGMPFGIWALLRLNDSDVKQAFVKLD